MKFIFSIFEKNKKKYLLHQINYSDSHYTSSFLVYYCSAINKLIIKTIFTYSRKLSCGIVVVIKHGQSYYVN